MQIKTTVGYLLTPFRMTTIKIKKKKAKQKIASIDEDVEKWKTLWVMDLKSSGLGSSPWWCLCWAVPAILLHMNPWSRRRIRWWAVFSVLTIVEPTAPVDVWCLMVRFTFSGARLTPQSWGRSALFRVRGLQRPPGGWKVSERVGSRDRSLVTSARATQHLSKDFFFFLILERFCLKIAYLWRVEQGGLKSQWYRSQSLSKEKTAAVRISDVLVILVLPGPALLFMVSFLVIS